MGFFRYKGVWNFSQYKNVGNNFLFFLTDIFAVLCWANPNGDGHQRTTTDTEISFMSSEKSDIQIYNQFYTMFGKAGFKRVLDGFGYMGQGADEKHFHQLTGRTREIVTQRMRDALKHETVKNKHRMVMKSDNSALERVWVAADGRETPISKMKDGHLHNTILMIDRRIEEGQWVIGRNEDLQELRAMMEEERERRGMPMPLIPIKSLEWRKRMVDTPSIARSANKENYND